jgi:Potential Queuosine, Q, salvage protein family
MSLLKKLFEKPKSTAGNFVTGVAKAVGVSVSDNILLDTIGNAGIVPSGAISSVIPGSPIPNPAKFVKELVESVARIFKDLADSVVNKLDYMVGKAADKLKDVGTSLVEKFEDVATRVLANASNTFKDLLEKAMNELRTFLDEAFTELRALLGEANAYVEARISQVAEIIASSLAKVGKIADSLPAKIRDELVIPTIRRLEDFQEQLFKDINNVIDKIIETINQKVAEFQSKVDLIAISTSKLGKETLKDLGLQIADLQLSDSNYYEFRKSYLIKVKERNGSITVKERLAIYDEIQENAGIMSFLNIVPTPGQDTFYAQEWLEYGFLRQETEWFLGAEPDIQSGERPSILEQLIQKALSI